MQAKQLKAVIFDMDGVIVDTFELYYKANKAVADRLSLPFTREDNNEFRGIGRMEIVTKLVARAEKNLSEAEIVKLANWKNEFYQQLIKKIDERAILPGMKEFISELKENNVKMAIASSSTNAKTVLQHVGLIDYFDHIVDPTTLEKGKPDPEIFLKAVEAFNVDSAECAAIEDGVAGLQAINQTDMFSVAVGEAVANEPADWHVTDTSEITYETLIKKFKGENNET